MKFVCIKKCFHNNVLYDEGQVVNAKELNSPHFKPYEEEQVVVHQIVEEKNNIDEEEVEEMLTIEEMQEELERNGKAFDRRWGRERLEAELRLVKGGK